MPRAISKEIMFGKSDSGIHDLKVYDVDKDGRSEIILATDIDGDGAIGIYGIDNSDVIYLKWINSIRPDDAAFYSVEAGDIDNDGDIEIIAGAGREYDSGGTYIYVYDYKTGEEEWRSLHMGNNWDKVVSIELEDMDKDGIKEIIGMVESGSVYIFDGESKQLEAVLLGEHTALKVIEWKNAPMILLGDTNGDISAYRYISGSYTEIKRQIFLPERIDGISLGPEGTNQFFLGSKGNLTVVNPSGTVWQSSSYGEIFGKHTEVFPKGQWFVSAGSYGILAFKYNF